MKKPAQSAEVEDFDEKKSAFWSRPTNAMLAISVAGFFLLAIAERDQALEAAVWLFGLALLPLCGQLAQIALNADRGVVIEDPRWRYAGMFYTGLSLSYLGMIAVLAHISPVLAWLFPVGSILVAVWVFVNLRHVQAEQRKRKLNEESNPQP